MEKFPSGSYDNKNFKDKYALAGCKSIIKMLKNKKLSPGDFSVSIYEDWVEEYEQG